jgi:hypothetical protein
MRLRERVFLAVFFLPPKSLNRIMDSYWDLYVAYVHHCIEYNKKHDIDPHHYQMEWNHFLPKSIFGDWPIGQWLTLKQHAIASALQTLAFGKNCMCGWHKKYLPGPLLALSWTYYGQISEEEGKKRGRRLNTEDEEGNLPARKGRKNAHKEKDELGRSILGVKNSERLNAEKNKEGKSLNAVKGVQRMNELLHADRDEFGRSIFALQSLSNTYQDLDEEGVSVRRRRNGHRLHEEKDELGRSLVTVGVNNQVWESTVDGHRGNSSAVARHNRANGWDPSARIRIS